MESMIERVAKAIAKVETGREVDDDFFREHAIAAIEALREPTNEMMNASARNLIDQYHASKADEPKTFVEELDVEDLWCAAIDSILKGARETA
jgi:hypothetical protein